LRIAPQFGISLLAYETLSQWLGFQKKPSHLPPTNVPVDPNDFYAAFPAARSVQAKTKDYGGWMRPSGPN
jgi:hypothetical protein